MAGAVRGPPVPGGRGSERDRARDDPRRQHGRAGPGRQADHRPRRSRAHRSPVAPAITALAAAGWQHQGDLGIPGREAFEPVPDPAYHHLYLVVADSPAHRDHLDLRDYLRTHPAECERYAALKRRLAPLLAADRDAYVTGNADLVTELLERARQPARPRQPER
jgi:GrpB-like predicted nucleotidyltransferase (UPF0157 family)